MYRPVLVTPPQELPVTLAEAKAQLRVDHEDEDELIARQLRAAIGYLDGWGGILGRCLVTQTWRQDYANFCQCLRLPLWPVASVTSLKYLDTAGAEQTIGPSNYALRADELGAYVEFEDTYSFPAVRSGLGPRVSVTYVAGDAAASVPENAKHAIHLLLGHWYENRETVVTGTIASALPLSFDALIRPLRRVGV